MELEHKYIYKVYQEGSISKAAEKLFITQPALSIAIQRVEAAIGQPIFDRNKRPLELTPAGVEYIKTIKEIQLLEESLQQKIADMRQLKSGKITIGGSHYLQAYILPPSLTNFAQRYPNVSIALEEHGSSVIAEMIAEQKLDLTFSCDPEFVHQYEHYPAFEDRILLAVPEKYAENEIEKAAALTPQDILAGKHLLEACPTVSLNQFKELEYILLSKGNNLYERSMKMFKTAGFEPKIKLFTSQLVTSYHLAESGLAAAFVSDHLVVNKNAKLLFYKLRSEESKRQFYVVLPKRKYKSFAVRKLIEMFLKTTDL